MPFCIELVHQTRARFAALLALALLSLICIAVRSEAAHGAILEPERASPFSGPLVIAGTPEEAEQLRANEEARRMTPEAFLARASSQTAYEQLSDQEAKGLAESAFPELISEVAGGPPRLAAGERITRFLGDYTAQLELP